jgi:formamidopyrimidine-DNA glycosylase
MPELAEVEFFRKQWNDGLGQKILSVELHSAKRIFRGANATQIEQTLTGAKFLESRAHGKQMLFHFSNGGWLGVHLGMTGKMRTEKPSFTPGKHDHLVLRQKKQALVFSDPRQFGRVLFHRGPKEPQWWAKLPPGVTSPQFTFDRFNHFLQRHSKAPIKAVLLMQNGFPGIGNWMADEILWQSKLNPRLHSRKIVGVQKKLLFQKTQFVCRQALKIIGKVYSDPPKSWLFHHRWEKKAKCPRCKTTLQHATIGGRTTCWCPSCQK